MHIIIKKLEHYSNHNKSLIKILERTMNIKQIFLINFKSNNNIKVNVKVELTNVSTQKKNETTWIMKIKII